MKKAVVVCILVVVLACTWSSVAFASPQEPDGSKYWMYVQYDETKRFYFESTVPIKKETNGIRTVGAYMVFWESTDNGDTWTLKNSALASASCDFPTPQNEDGIGYIILANHDIMVYGSDPPETYYYKLPYGDAEVVITSPIDLYQDNAKRWKLRSVLAINDVEGGFDTSKLSYVLEVCAGPIYSQLEMVSVTYREVQDELYIMTEEDRVVNMKTFEFEPPASRGKARIICLYDNEVIATAEVRYHRYSGFVDENGDSLDDRTGLPDHSNESDYELIIEMPQKPEDGDLLAWLEYIGELFGYVFEVIISVLKDFAEGVVDGLRVILEIVEPMFSFVEQFFASLPAPMSAAMIALVTLSAVLGILKLLRG